MTISIIQLDSRSPAGQFEGLLPQARIIRFDSGEELPGAADLTGLIVLGGRQNAYDPALRPVADLMVAATSGEVPTLGVCLGAQLLATSHGGRVEVSAPAGPEQGIVGVRTRPEAQKDPVLGGAVAELGREFDVVSMHEDAITELPRGSVWLAASKQYPYQAFRLGSALGVQFHPEADGAQYGQWMSLEQGVDPAEAHAQWQAGESRFRLLAGAITAGFTARN